jgi:acyl phosphate:glycerol-3-phosphate acyltransferase
MNQALVIGTAIGSYLLGSIPFSNIVAHFWAGIDLRQVGTGTVTPRNLYDETGWRPAILAGFFEMAKGVAGPLVVFRHPVLVIAVIGALAVAGHNWSIFMRGAGGRGVSTATGVFFVMAWPAAVVMTAGFIGGLLVRRLGPAISAAFCVVVPVLIWTGGVRALYGGLIVLAPIALKSVLLVRKRGLPRWRRSSRPAGQA